MAKTQTCTCLAKCLYCLVGGSRLKITHVLESGGHQISQRKLLIGAWLSTRSVFKNEIQLGNYPWNESYHPNRVSTRDKTVQGKNKWSSTNRLLALLNLLPAEADACGIVAFLSYKWFRK